MSIQVKNGGSYSDVTNVFVKKDGTYEDVVGVFAKIAGVYSSISSSQFAATFNGTSSYATIPPWTPTGKFGVFVKLADALPTTADAFFIVDGSNRYIGARATNAKSQFGSSFPGPNIINVGTTGMCGIVIEAGVIRAWDGVTWTSTSNAEIVTNYTYTTIGKRGAAYSTMSVEWIVLYDFVTPSNSRAYIAQADGTLFDAGYGATQPTCYNLIASKSKFDVFTPAVPIWEVSTVSQWESKYASSGYNTTHPNFVASPTINTDFGEAFAWSGQYWIQTYLVMHKVTGNETYLTRAKTLIDYILYNRDSQRFARGEIFCEDRTGVGGIDDRYNDAPKQYMWTSDGGVALTGVPAKGWRRKNGALWQVGVLIDGVISSGIARYCHYVLSKPSMSARHADALAMLNICAEIANDHNLAWSDTKNAGFQSYFYTNPTSNNWGNSGMYSNPLAYNHTFSMMLTMAICNAWLTPDSLFSDKIVKTVSFWRNNRWVAADGSYQWWYSFDITPTNRKSQDINHAGNLELPFFYWLAKLGHMTQDELRLCAKGLANYAEFGDTGVMRYRIDGSYKFDGDNFALAADALCVSQNALLAGTVEDSIIPLSRRVASLMLPPNISWSQWGTFSIVAYDLAIKAGALDVAA